jgi:hypothetical protein
MGTERGERQGERREERRIETEERGEDRGQRREERTEDRGERRGDREEIEDPYPSHILSTTSTTFFPFFLVQNWLRSIPKRLIL